MIDREQKISACIIVKNEESHLERALLSIKGLADELIVVDTGSTDRTKDIAHQQGASIYDYEWHDDFSAVRNFSISKASGDWILVIDADEAIARRDHNAIREIMYAERYEGAYFFQRNYFEDPSAENWCANQTDYEEGKQFAGYADVLVLRFFRNIDNIFYEGIVHEIVDETVNRKKVKYTDIPIHHFREDFSGEAVFQKQDKYLRILLQEYQQDPYSIKTCFLLGRQFHDMKKYPEAVAYLERAMQLGTNSEMVYTNLASAYYHCTMYQEAIETLENVIEFNDRYSEAFSMLGISYYESGRHSEAINALVKAISLRPTAVLYHYNLGAAYYKERNLEAAETTLRDAAKLCPRFTRIYYLLFHVLEEQGKVDDAIEVSRIIERMDETFFNKIKDRVTFLQAH